MLAIHLQQGQGVYQANYTTCQQRKVREVQQAKYLDIT